MRPRSAQPAGPLPGARRSSAEASAVAQRRRAQPAAARADGRAMAVPAARAADGRRRPGRRPGRDRARRGGRADVLFNVMPLSVDKPGDPLHRFSGFSASAAQCRPRVARTAARSRSTDPLRAAADRAGYLTEPLDREGARRRPRIAARDLRAAGVSRASFDGEEYLPGTDARTDAAALELRARHGRHGVPSASAPAAWAATRPLGRRSRGCACAASSGCASSTRR